MLENTRAVAADPVVAVGSRCAAALSPGSNGKADLWDIDHQDLAQQLCKNAGTQITVTQWPKNEWLAARLEDLDYGDIDGICRAARAYPLLGAKKAELPDPGGAAEALHNAIRSLRQIDPTNPLPWAPYIHLGP